MCEFNLMDAPDYTLMKIMTENMVKCGVWRQLMRKVQPNYDNENTGVIWCFTADLVHNYLMGTPVASVASPIYCLDTNIDALFNNILHYRP